MWTVRIGVTTFTLHNQGTMIVKFRHKAHADVTEHAIRNYVHRFHTLPPTYQGATAPLNLKHPTMWRSILGSLHVAEVDDTTLETLSEIHSASVLEVVDITGTPYVIEPSNLLHIGFKGKLHPPPELEISEYKQLFEYLL